MKQNLLSFYIILLLSLASLKVSAIKETYTSAVRIGSNELINPSNPYTITDARYSLMQNHSPASTDGKTFENLFYNKRIINRFLFRINKDDQTHQPYPYSATVKIGFTIEWYNPSIPGFEQQTMERVLKINYDPKNVNANETVLEFDDDAAFPLVKAGNKVIIEILQTNISPSTATNYANIELIPEIEVERFYFFAPEIRVDNNLPYNPTAAPNVSASVNATTKSIHFSITNPTLSGGLNFEAEKYDLEWVYVNNYDKGQSGAIVNRSASEIPFTLDFFNRSSSRITIQSGTFDLPIIYDKGFVVYRVRAYGRNAYDGYSTDLPGVWSLNGTSNTTLNQFTGAYIQIDNHSHNPTLNWQYSISFAEEGKYKVSTNYFDGTLRGQQTVVKSNSLNSCIVSDKIYDHQGRPAITVLPFPVNDPAIHFYPLQTLASNNTPYSKVNFDYAGSNLCISSTDPLSSSAGAGNFYSPSRNLTGDPTLDLMESYVPDAEGYPLTQTVFTPDNTGRVKYQTGLGTNFNLAGNDPKLTKYFYSKPFQEELIRLFGHEAGDASHYKKDMVVDPNGQVSISYLDAAGKVVATSLSGAKPAAMENLNTNQNHLTPALREKFTVDLLNKKSLTDKGNENILSLDGLSLNLNTSFVVPMESNIRLFTYGITNTTYTTTCPTISPANQCFNCVLDVKISLEDECGTTNYLNNFVNQTGISRVVGQTQLDALLAGTYQKTACSSASNYYSNNGTSLAAPHFEVSLASGTYYLNKTLKVNEVALDKYTELFLKENNCLKTYANFRDEQNVLLDVSGCNRSCAECLEQLGSYEQYIDPAPLSGKPRLSLDQYNDLLEQCSLACTTKSQKCQTAYQAMLLDVSPNGQYGQIRKEAVVENGIIKIPESEGNSTNPNIDYGKIDPRIFPLSVFNDGNLLPVNERFFPDAKRPNWRNPIYNGNIEDENYKDENGNEDFIFVEFKDGVFSPEISAFNLIRLIPVSEGKFKIKPQYVKNVTDFLKYWKPSWAKSLIIFHPEYGLNNLCHFLQESHDYDASIMETQTYSDAVTKNLFNPLGTDFNSHDGADPLFRNATNKGQPYASSDDYTHFKSLLENFVSDGTIPPVSLGIWQFAYQIVMNPNENITCNTTSTIPTITDFSNPFPFLTTQQKDEIWNVFKGLYLSIKNKYLDDKTARITISYPGTTDYGGYNGCIGKKNFDATRYGFSTTPILNTPFREVLSATFALPDINSQFYNYEQPCNCQRYAYYREKTARFPIADELLSIGNSGRKVIYDEKEENYAVINSYEENLALLSSAEALAKNTIFERCGKCPIAFDLETFLDGLAINQVLNNTIVDLQCNVKGLTEPLFSAFGASLGDELDWNASESASSTTSPYELAVTINKDVSSSSVTICNLKMLMPSNSVLPTNHRYSFSDIIGFYQIQYVPASDASFNYNFSPNSQPNNQFYILARVIIHPDDPLYDPAQPNKTRDLLVKGASSCIDIGSCSLPKICEASETATELMGLFNTLIFSGQSFNTGNYTNYFLSSQQVNICDTTIDKLKYGISSQVKYFIDKAIKPEYKNLYEQWLWNATSITANKVEFNIAGSSTGNNGNCSLKISLNQTKYPNLSLATDEIIKFTHIQPNPEDVGNGFLATALIKRTSVSPNTYHYVVLEGKSPCFYFGNCTNGLPAPYDMSKNTQTLNCQKIPNKEEFLGYLNGFEGTVGNSNWSSNNICVPCEIYDQSGYKNWNYGFEHERKLPKTNPSKTINDFETQLNALVPSQLEINSWGTCNPCPTASPIRYIRLYGNYYKEKYTLPDGTVNLNPDGGNAVVNGMYYACISSGEYIPIYDRFGNPTRFHQRVVKYIDLPVSPCFNAGWDPDGVPVFDPNTTNYFNVVRQSNGSFCEIYYGYHSNGDCDTNVKIPLCGNDLPYNMCGGGENPGKQWCISTPQNLCGESCPLQVEFPFNAYTWDDVMSVLDILPDQDRPEKGYFKMLVKFHDENILEVKAYNPCMEEFDCKSCEGEEVAWEGTLKVSTNIRAMTDSNSYIKEASGSSPYLGSGRYLLIDRVPVLTPSTDPAAINDHTPGGLTNFYICKSHSPLSQSWSQHSLNPSLDSLPFIWGKRYKVQPHTDYEVSFFYVNANKAAAAANNALLVRINHKDILEKEVAFDNNHTWKKLSFNWNSGKDEFLDLGIFNIENDTDNYIAFDDLSIKRICGCTGGPLSLNPDLEQGNYGLGVDANIVHTQAGGTPGTLGSYYVGENQSWVNIFPTTAIGEHTYNGIGKVAAYNLTANNANAIVNFKVWSQKIDVVRNKDYDFNFWWKMPSTQNVSFGNHKAVINIKLNGTIIQSLETGNNGDSWNIIKAKWNSGDYTLADLQIEVSIDRRMYQNSFDFALDDIVFKENCNGEFCQTKAPYVPVLERNLELECVNYMNFIKDHNAKIAYETYKLQVIKDFREAYIAKCLSVQETFQMKLENNEYHTTLYYYDQAGNLVRTVPPQGVDPLTEAEINAVKEESMAGAIETYNSHTFVTNYKYNSLNQLVSQATPDQEDFNVFDGSPANLYPLGSNQTVNSICYVDKYRGIVVGENTATANGFIKYGDPIKNTWVDNAAPIDYGDFVNIHVVSAIEVYASTKEGAIVYTTDGGILWYSKNAPVDDPIIYIRKLGTSTLVAFDENGNYWKSSDLGATWDPKFQISAVALTVKSITNNGNSFALLASDGSRYFCNDISIASPQWAKHGELRAENLEIVGKYKDLTKWFAIGNKGFMMSSTDNGLNWEWMPSNLSTDVKKAYLWNDVKGVFLTSDNRVYYTEYGATDFVNLTEYMGGANFVDFAVYGNFVYLLEENGNVYINNMFGSSAWSSNTSILPTANSGYTKIRVFDDNTLFVSRNSSPSNIEVFQVKKNSGPWISSLVNLGVISNGFEILDIHPFSSTKIELVLFDGSTNYLYEVKDINISSNSSTLTNLVLSSSFIPEKFEVNTNQIPFLVAKNGSSVKAFEKNTLSIWTPFTYQLPLTSSQFKSLWMENSNPNSKGICVGSGGEISATIFKWKPTTLNASTTFDRSNRIKIPKLQSLYHNGTEIIAVGEKGAIAYSTVTSGNASPTWKLLHHGNTKTNLNDITGNNNGDFVAVGQDGFLLHIYKNSSTLVASKLDQLPVNLFGRHLVKVNIHNYTNGNATLNVLLVDHDNMIHRLGFTLSNHTYVNASYSDANMPAITNKINSVGSSGNTAYFMGNKPNGSGQTHQILKLAYTSGPINPTGITISNVNPLYKVTTIPNTNALVAVGKAGFLIISYNKGLSWKSKYTGVSNDLSAVSFADENNGIAVGKNKTVVFTSDGGKSWQSQSISGANYDFVDVAMASKNRTLALIKYETPSPNVSNILQCVTNLSTTPNWTAITGTHSLTALFNSISFPGPKYAFIAGNNNQVLRLSYNGSAYVASVLQNSSNQNWSTVLSSNNTNLYSIYFRDYENGFVGGDNGFLMRTRNGGASLPIFESSPSYCGKKIKVINGLQNENLHLIQYGSTASDTVVCLKNFEFSTKFYYDGLGRMVASQNTKQMREGKTVYSYTLYDYKGRIIEVGKKTANNTIENATATLNNVSGPVYDLGMVDYNRFEAWIRADISTYPRKEVTRTFYDNQLYTISLNNGQFRQDNLRGRVVSSTYTDLLSASDIDVDASNDTYLSASHYSYDIHGNVKSLVQENRILAGSSSELVAKQLDYEYDLISGKVNKVIYQKAMPDQFIHKYAYDADNRIIEVETSHDGTIWQRDAKYIYYRHGPLARVELGTQQVQGIDYAYTIQGWLKGVNSTNLKGENDIGKDAYLSTANANAYFAKDEFGFSLNYFDDDYAATKMPNYSANYFLGETNNSGLNGSTHNLYNGNIKSMVTTLSKFNQNGQPVANGMAYVYDQLNRIIAARNNTNYDAANNNWLSGGTSNAYESNFTYDANGNILTLNRKDEAGTLYDDFDYTYSNLSTGNIKNTNRLTRVTDAVTASAYVGDIENGQSANNYQYDAIGNLISDAQEEIQNIEWNVYGKIKSINRTSSSTKPSLEFLYDPTGNRIGKIVKPAGGNNLDWQYTLYFRDAQGNIMSTYEYQNTSGRQQNTYIYGSSRIGEFNPEGFMECGAYFRVSELDDRVELKNWLKDYIENVLGFSTNFSNSMASYIDTELETDLGLSLSTFSQNNQTDYKRFVMNLCAMLCRIRLFDELDDQDFNDVVKPKIKEWLTYAGTQSQGWTTFTEALWLDLEANRKQIAEDLYVALLSQSNFVYDDGTHFYGLGSRRYELSNHLGNVLAVITDKKIPQGQGGNFTDLIVLSSPFLTGTEDWEAIGGSTLSNTNDALAISGNNAGIGAQNTVSLKENTAYNLSFELTYAGNASDIMVTLKDQSQATLYSGNASNASGANSLAISLGTFSNPLSIEITNNSSGTSFTLDNITLTQDGIAGVSYYTAQLVSAQDYYPFGTTLPGRTFQDDRFDGYRFGFNGKELDKAGMGGGGSTYDYGFRIYNAQLGKFLSVDPLTKSYAWYTPYQFAGNTPIQAIDLEGKEPDYFMLSMMKGYAKSKIENPNSSEITHLLVATMSHPLIQIGLDGFFAPFDMASSMHISGNTDNPALKQHHAESAKEDFLGIVIGLGTARMVGGAYKTFFAKSSKFAFSEAGNGIRKTLEKNFDYIKSFKDGKYAMREATEDLTIYRVGHPDGEFFTTVKPTSSKEADELLNVFKYGNNAEQVTTFTLKKGSQYAIGDVEGGKGVQIIIFKEFKNSGGNKLIQVGPPEPLKPK